MTSVITYINTGSGPDAGNGDSLRTAFNKINENLKALENSYIQSGVASFNGQGGVITFTATDIASVLGFTPYDAANPNQYVTNAAVQDLASLAYLNSNFVSTSTLLNYATLAYVNNTLTQFASLAYITSQGFIRSANIGNYLSPYATLAYVQTNYVSTLTIVSYLNQNKQTLLPLTDATYDIGNLGFRWRDLYLSNSITLGTIPITIDTVTLKLLVNNQSVTGNYVFDTNLIHNSGVSFDIRSEANSQFDPGAGIHFPNNSESLNSPIKIYSTFTGGVLIAADYGLQIIGDVQLPVTFSQSRPGNGNPQANTVDKLIINQDFADGVPANTIPLRISATKHNTIDPSDLIVEGTNVGLRSSSLNLYGNNNIAIMTTAGFFIGDALGYPNNGTLKGYILPIRFGNTGTTLLSNGDGTVSWSTQTFGSSNINSNNAVFNTATIIKRFTLGTDGLTFLDGSNMSTAYGNQQVSDFLPQYNGALSVGYIAGQGTQVDIISNGLKWQFSATGVLSFPDGAQMGELYGSGFDIRANPSGYVKLDSNSGNNYVRVDNLGIYLNSTGKQWTFGTDGVLSLPAGGDIRDSGGASVLGSGGIIFSISANGSMSYVFSGPGIVSGNTDNPILYLYRGFTYTFINNAGGAHPFAIRVSNGGANYTSGLSGSQTGTQTFTVPMNAPSSLYYQCTFHSMMGNVINIV